MSDLIQNQTIEKSTGGLVCLALFICYRIGQVISGYLGDKIKPKHMLSIGLIATGICNAFTYLGVTISAYGFAVISESLGWSFTVLSWVIVSILGITLCLLAKRKYTNYIIQN